MGGEDREERSEDADDCLNSRPMAAKISEADPIHMSSKLGVKVR